MKKLLATTALMAALFAGAQSAQAGMITQTFSIAGSDVTFNDSLVTLAQVNPLLNVSSVTVTFQEFISSDGDITIHNKNLADSFSGKLVDTPVVSLYDSSTIPATLIVSTSPSPSPVQINFNLAPGATSTTSVNPPGIEVDVSAVLTGPLMNAFIGNGNLGNVWVNGDAIATILNGVQTDPVTGVHLLPDGSLPGALATNWVTNIALNGTITYEVPTPTPLALLGFGLVALAFVSRKRRSDAAA
ncbi:MAG: hypothetical protein EPO08_16820 [Rhodospirillaceae bacterium]|nr:MAG: hypothetical protein EPO08_16820 [Rhodospirillaceae bacterium]